jgi:hypothetical protein
MTPDIESATKVMPIRVVMTMPPAWMLRAYADAVARAREGSKVAGNGTAYAITVAVGEALMWLDAQRQRDRTVGRGRELAAELHRDPVVKALVYFRARLHHHWAPVGYLDEGVWVWARADTLPLAKDRHANTRGETLYRQHLEGRPVMDALEAVQAKLESLVPDE